MKLFWNSLLQYDLSASQFSPDGRVFQVEYAQKAVENSGYVLNRSIVKWLYINIFQFYNFAIHRTAVALKGRDGVVLAVEKLVGSKLYEAGANKRIFTVDRHIGIAVAGLLADARAVVEIAKDEAKNYRSEYGSPIPIKVNNGFFERFYLFLYYSQYLKDRVSMYMHAYTLYSALRPFGSSLMVASYDKIDGPQLYCLDPSGLSLVRVTNKLCINMYDINTLEK